MPHTGRASRGSVCNVALVSVCNRLRGPVLCECRGVTITFLFFVIMAALRDLCESWSTVALMKT